MPPDPLICNDWRLTGAWRPRIDWRRKVVVQVEEVRSWRRAMRQEWTSQEWRWRDARPEDVIGDALMEAKADAHG